jgi:hypothetical protein
MLAITPLHVLFVYGAKRLNGIMEFGQSVSDEMCARANKLPPDQREAAMKAMIADRKRIEHEVYLVKKQEKEFADAFAKVVRRVCWLCIGIPLLAWFLFSR